MVEQKTVTQIGAERFERLIEQLPTKAEKLADVPGLINKIGRLTNFEFDSFVDEIKQTDGQNLKTTA